MGFFMKKIGYCTAISNKNLLFLLFICGIIIYTNAHCMLKISDDYAPKLKYDPQLIPNDSTMISIRKMLNHLTTFEEQSKQLKSNDLEELRALDSQIRNVSLENNILHSIRLPTDEERKYRCQDYALAKTLGFKGEVMHFDWGSESYLTLNIFKYFKETNKPRTNDLVVYSDDQHDSHTNHIGIVLDNGLIESKWGSSSEIVVHQLFSVPLGYGDYARFFTLKNAFKQLPKNLLLAIMHNDMIINSYDLQRNERELLIKYYTLIKSYDKQLEKVFPLADILGLI